jgi:nucleoside phosphorylase
LPKDVSAEIIKNPNAHISYIEKSLMSLAQENIDAKELISYLCPTQKSRIPNMDLLKVDIVILTALQEEYEAICSKLLQFNKSLSKNIGSEINNYAWKLGNIYCENFKGSYRIAAGLMARPGGIQSTLAAIEAIRLWKPNFLIFSGIAGGFSEAGLKKGDVIIVDYIHGYEYGKINEKFEPRDNSSCKTDPGLLRGAIDFGHQNSWHDLIAAKPPIECIPKVTYGEIASGEKVIDDPSNEFFKYVLKRWPKIKAVEMEGAGIGSAIEQAQSLKIPVSFMVIRAISDLPRHAVENENKDRATKERDAWKIYASNTAAAFTIGWIADGLPIKPSK